ncbi:MAG: phosphoheptose isomerase [Thaumarchaeota archaeon]|nr:phosphoheptose isomerase [Nitrososphaerota archaeon]
MGAENRRIFLIDVDGTVCEHIGNEEGPERMRVARPFEDSIREVNKLYDEGHYICFFTARLEKHRKPTEDWLRKHGVKHHQVIFNKPRKLPPYSEYHFIDDAHVRATTFKGKFTRFVKKKVEIDAFED